MKTAKRITAIFLCFVMLLGVSITSASALEIGDTVDFKYTYDDGDGYKLKCYYEGIAEEGVNLVSATTWKNACFEFNAEKAGYYAVKFNLNDNFWIDFAQTYQNAVAKNYAESIDGVSDDGLGTRYQTRIYYLEKGLHFILVTSSESKFENAVLFQLDYFAESIADIRFKDEVSAKYVFEDDDDFMTHIKGDEFEYEADYVIEFSNSKTFDPESWLIHCTTESEIVTGENTVKMQLPGFEKELTIFYHKTSDFVESIEPSNIEDYLDATIFYNNDFKTNKEYDGEKVTVIFKDGTKQTITYERKESYDNDNLITFPCGTQISLYVFSSYDNLGNPSVEARIGDTCFYFKCNTKECSFKENLSHLKDSIELYIEWMDFDYCIEQFLESGNFSYLTWLGRNIKEEVPRIFDEISTFIRYYL